MAPNEGEILNRLQEILCIQMENKKMSERFIVHTKIRANWRGLADHYVTTIFDQQTGIMVACAADTSEESEEEATKQLAILNSRQGSVLASPAPYLSWRY